MESRSTISSFLDRPSSRSSFQLSWGCSWAVAPTTNWEPKGPAWFATIYVAPVGNKAKLPDAQAVFSTLIRDALSKDGRVALANSPEAADATLEVTVLSYTRQVAAVREVDTGLASKFTLTLHTECTLTNSHREAL